MSAVCINRVAMAARMAWGAARVVRKRRPVLPCHVADAVESLSEMQVVMERVALPHTIGRLVSGALIASRVADVRGDDHGPEAA
jgi:hypothetical protein